MYKKKKKDTKLASPFGVKHSGKDAAPVKEKPMATTTGKAHSGAPHGKTGGFGKSPASPGRVEKLAGKGAHPGPGFMAKMAAKPAVAVAKKKAVKVKKKKPIQ